MSRRLWLRLGAAACAALMAGGVALAALVAMRQPLSTGDYVAIWGLKARAMARSGEVSSVFRVDPGGEFSHPEYPLLWPAFLTLLAGLLGRWDDLLLTPLWPLLCAVGSLAAVRMTRGPWAFRFLAGAAVSLLPYYRRYFGYAEALLVVLVLLALAETDRLETDRHAPMRLAVFLTLAAWTKQEGVLLALVAAGVLLTARKLRVGLLVFLSAILFAVVPWFLFLQRFDPQTPRRDFAAASFSIGHLWVAGQTLVTKALVPNAGWLIGGALLLALAPLTRARRRGILVGASVYAGLLFLAFAFARVDPAWLVTWSWDRLAFVLAVALLPIAAEAAAECLTSGSEEASPARGESPAAEIA